MSRSSKINELFEIEEIIDPGLLILGTSIIGVGSIVGGYVINSLRELKDVHKTLSSRKPEKDVTFLRSFWKKNHFCPRGWSYDETKSACFKKEKGIFKTTKKYVGVDDNRMTWSSQ